jgi:tRNA(adenine34) deaminase
MAQALLLARQAIEQGEVPVGAVLVKEGLSLGQGYNRLITACDPTAHAEIVALRQAAVRLGNYRLVDTTLYVTLEPCPMCAGALLQARVKRLVFGAWDPRAGAAGTVFNLLQSEHLNHRTEVQGGVLGELCGELLRDFFRSRRAKIAGWKIAQQPS